MIWIVKDPDDYNRLVADMVKESGETRVWCFYGDLGSGKTTIIQHLCKYLGVCDPVVSPTFSIVNLYRTQSTGIIYHFDLYRLQKPEEVFDIGFSEYVDSGQYCFIEWPELAESMIPEEYVSITMKVLDEGKREITYHVYG